MVRPSQFQISDLASYAHCGEKGHKLMALIFKMDESYDEQKTIMTLGGWLMEQSQWKTLETDWANCIGETNKSHRADQQIKRFHASEMNCYDGDFRKWDKPMSESFTANLISIIKARPCMFVVAAVNMHDMVSVFPDQAAIQLESAYGLCFKQAMISIGYVVRKHFARDTVGIVFESGNWNKHAIDVYNQMLADKKFKDRSLFISASAFANAKCVGLQAADLIAYESMRRILAASVRTDAKLRWALKQLLGNKQLGESAYIEKKALVALRGQ